MEIIIAIIGSGLLSLLLTRLFTVIDKRKNKRDGLWEGVTFLLEDKIREMCKFYIIQGYISLEDYKTLVRAWNIYHEDLKGNGYLNALMEKVVNLPNDKIVIQEEDEK